ncbi:MAG: hypothetical protein LDL24_08895 [Treponema sp.]|nr:hypothetical protein [Treponema sp.]
MMKSYHLYPPAFLGVVLISFVMLLGSCNFSFDPNINLVSEVTVNLNINQGRQVIDGFGGSNAWMSLPSDSATRNEVVRLLFSRDQGIGLTILRNRIPFRELNKDGNDDKFINKDGKNQYIYSEQNGVKTFSLNWTNWDLQNTKTLIGMIKALHQGPENLVVMSTPWTPPNNAATNWKLSVLNVQDYPEVGGYLDPNRYEDYADLLADYVHGFTGQMGHPLAVLSIQNEPTWEPNYESCKWDGTQIKIFLKVLGSRFPLKGVSSMLSIMAPEDENFREDLVLPALADEEARNVLSIVGVHQYDYTSKQNLAAQWLTQSKTHNKKIWMTEVSNGGTNDSSINDGLLWATMIHYDMVIAEVNAFLYWWLWTNTNTFNQTGSSLLHVVNGTSILKNKRLYTLGNYSRFVRHGFVRIATVPEPLPGVLLSAYASADRKKVVVVGINTSNKDRTVTIALQGLSSQSEINMWRTSETEDLLQLPLNGEYSVASNELIVKLAARSVSTLEIIR